MKGIAYKTERVINEVKRIAMVAKDKFMATNYVNLPDDLKQCITTVNWLCDHPIQIVKQLQIQSQHPDKKFEKFPLIALFTDVPIYAHKYGDYDGTTLNIVFVMYTNPDFFREQRVLKTFEPFIRPLVDYFFTELVKSSVFSFVDETQDIRGTLWERYYWGKQGTYGNEGVVLSDYVDAAQIENLDLKININC